MEAPAQTSPPASETGSYDGLLQTHRLMPIPESKRVVERFASACLRRVPNDDLGMSASYLAAVCVRATDTSAGPPTTMDAHASSSV